MNKDSITSDDENQDEVMELDQDMIKDDQKDDLIPRLGGSHLNEFLSRYMSLRLGEPKLAVLDLHDGGKTIPV